MIGYNSRRPQLRAPRPGAALIELAISLILLVTLVFGCVDFGRYAYVYIAVGNAAREGSYLASVTPHNSHLAHAMLVSAARDRVIDELSDIPGFDVDKISISGPTFEGDGGDRSRVRMEVGYPFQSIVPFPPMSGPLSLRRSVVMRVIR